MDISRLHTGVIGTAILSTEGGTVVETDVAWCSKRHGLQIQGVQLASPPRLAKAGVLGQSRITECTRICTHCLVVCDTPAFFGHDPRYPHRVYSARREAHT
jgi:hypothetical protein